MCNHMKTIHSVCGHTTTHAINRCAADPVTPKKTTRPPKTPPRQQPKTPDPVRPTPCSLVRAIFSNSEFQRLRADFRQKQQPKRKRSSSAPAPCAHPKAPRPQSTRKRDISRTDEVITLTLQYRQQLEASSSEDIHDRISTLVSNKKCNNGRDDITVVKLQYGFCPSCREHYEAAGAYLGVDGVDVTKSVSAVLKY